MSAAAPPPAHYERFDTEAAFQAALAQLEPLVGVELTK